MQSIQFIGTNPTDLIKGIKDALIPQLKAELSQEFQPKQPTEYLTTEKVKHAEILHNKISEKIAEIHCANFPHKKTENKEVIKTYDVFPTLIKVEFAQYNTNPIVKHLNKMINFEERKERHDRKGVKEKRPQKKLKKTKT